jgi:hypothetical protein
MTHQLPVSRPAFYAIAALALLGLLGGWLILLSGGFHHQLHRYTKETVFVTGLPALLMAAMMFGLSVLGMLALVRTRGASLFWQVSACGAVLLPPAIFIVTV